MPWGLLIAKYGMSHFHPCHFMIRGMTQGTFISSFLCVFYQRHTPAGCGFSGLFIYSRLLPSPHLVFSGCCGREGLHQHYSLQSFPLARELPFPFPACAPASNDTPRITRAHMLTCVRARAAAEPPTLHAKVHANESPGILLSGKLSHGPSARVN